MALVFLAHILTQPPSATSTHAPPKAAFIHHTLILLFETLHRKHILRSWVSLSTPPTGCTTCDTKHYTKPAARKHTTCHIQGICVSAPSGGPRHFEGNKLRAHLFRKHFPNISKIPGRLFQHFYPEVSVSPSHTASKYLMALRAEVQSITFLPYDG